jgi:hypothetical protein
MLKCSSVLGSGLATTDITLMGIIGRTGVTLIIGLTTGMVGIVTTGTITTATIIGIS